MLFEIYYDQLDVRLDKGCLENLKIINIDVDNSITLLS